MNYQRYGMSFDERPNVVEYGGEGTKKGGASGKIKTETMFFYRHQKVKVHDENGCSDCPTSYSDETYFEFGVEGV